MVGVPNMAPMSISSAASRPSAFLLTAVLAVGSLLAACGGDDGADVRQLGDDTGGSASASGSASGPASGSASGTAASGSEAATGSGSASGVAGGAECEPVGEDLESEATTTVEIALADYEFVPSDITIDEAGVVTFAVSNTGEEPHELAFLPGGVEVPFTEDGQPDEAALEEMGAFELEAFGPGQDCEATYELEPGEYTIFCIVPAPDGETHYEKGMSGTVTVG